MRTPSVHRLLETQGRRLAHPDYRVREQALGELFEEQLKDRPLGRLSAAEFLLHHSEHENVQRSAVAQMARAIIADGYGHRRVIETTLAALEKPLHSGAREDLMNLLPALTRKDVPLARMPRHVVARLLDRLSRTADSAPGEGKHPGLQALVGIYHLSRHGPAWCRPKATAILHRQARNPTVDAVRDKAVEIVLGDAYYKLDHGKKVGPETIRTLKILDESPWIADSEHWEWFYHLKKKLDI